MPESRPGGVHASLDAASAGHASEEGTTGSPAAIAFAAAEGGASRG